MDGVGGPKCGILPQAGLFRFLFAYVEPLPFPKNALPLARVHDAWASSANASRAAWIVWAMSSRVWALDTKAASNWEGGK